MRRIKNKKSKFVFDFDTRKSLHIRVRPEIKEQIKAVSDRMNISIQDIFECFADLVASEDVVAIRMINKKIETKEEGKKTNNKDDYKYTSYDADALINMEFGDIE